MEAKKYKYKNFEHLCFDRGIKYKVIAVSLGVSEKALKNKRTGISKFTWDEVCIIQGRFFPDISKEKIFETNPQAS